MKKASPPPAKTFRRFPAAPIRTVPAYHLRKEMAATLLYFFSRLLRVFAIGLWVLMLVRAILSWIPVDDDAEESAFSRVVFLITEPLIVPVRSLLNLFVDVEGLPVDVAFFITFLLIGALTGVPLAS